jgi:multiple sugar transport system substrate-binding protein
MQRPFDDRLLCSFRLNRCVETSAMNRLGKWLGRYGTLFWLITSAPAFAADLTVWWTRGYYPEEDEGIRRIVADFEKDTGQSVVLNYWTQEDLPTKVIAALAADELPDVVYCVSCSGHLVRWAHDGLLFDLTEVIEPIADQMDPGALRARGC